MLKDFREFVLKGNVVDLAVAVIIGGAFGRIISSMVENVLMPIIGIFLGGISLAELHYSVGNATLNYGLFIQSIVDFLIIALVIFMIIKAINSLKRKEVEVVSPPAPSREEVILTEIRNLLKNRG